MAISRRPSLRTLLPQTRHSERCRQDCAVGRDRHTAACDFDPSEGTIQGLGILQRLELGEGLVNLETFANKGAWKRSMLALMGTEHGRFFLWWHVQDVRWLRKQSSWPGRLLAAEEAAGDCFFGAEPRTRECFVSRKAQLTAIMLSSLESQNEFMRLGDKVWQCLSCSFCRLRYSRTSVQSGSSVGCW